MTNKGKGWKRASANGGDSAHAAAPTTTTTGAGGAASAGEGPHHHNKSLFWRGVRVVRTFDAKVFLHKHVFGIYASVVGGTFVYANYLQHERMKKLYPDYDDVAKNTGAQYGTMKEQELSDVNAFVSRATNMRADLKSRMI